MIRETKFRFYSLMSEALYDTRRYFLPLFVNVFFWLISLPVPFVNLVTTSALVFGLPQRIAEGNPLSFAEVFKRTYFENAVHFLLMLILSFPVVILSMLVPFAPFVLLLDWELAPCLIFQKDYPIFEAFRKSPKLMNGHRLPLFFAELLSLFALLVALLLVWAISLFSPYLGGFLALITFFGFMVLWLSVKGVTWRMLGFDEAKFQKTAVKKSKKRRKK